jgi:SAM-dependent methyltransferase
MALETTEVGGPDDIRDFFDRLAPLYRDSHGPADRLLRYRLGLVRRLLRGSGRDLLVEIGCGTGLHLFPLAAEFRRVHGTDLAPGMIKQAEALRLRHPHGDRVSLSVDPAEQLASVADGTADAVLCVGAFEHMPDKGTVLRQVQRALKPGGSFVCLTPNGDFVWYAWLAPRLGLATTHLSSDRFVGAAEFRQLLREAGLCPETLGHWTFIPRGDLPPCLAPLLALGDWFGKQLRIPRLRGGLCCRAVKSGSRPVRPEYRSDG